MTRSWTFELHGRMTQITTDNAAQKLKSCSFSFFHHRAGTRKPNLPLVLLQPRTPTPASFFLMPGIERASSPHSGKSPKKGSIFNPLREPPRLIPSFSSLPFPSPAPKKDTQGCSPPPPPPTPPLASSLPRHTRTSSSQQTEHSLIFFFFDVRINQMLSFRRHHIAIQTNMLYPSGLGYLIHITLLFSLHSLEYSLNNILLFILTCYIRFSLSRSSVSYHTAIPSQANPRTSYSYSFLHHIVSYHT